MICGLECVSKGFPVVMTGDQDEQHMDWNARLIMPFQNIICCSD
jgi:hypothetical protein